MNVAEMLRRWWREHESRADDIRRRDAEQADRARRVTLLERQLRVQLRQWDREA